MPTLGVNLDHIATLRQARWEFDPDPISAVPVCEAAGAHCIIAHLREDRRHIQDADLKRLKARIQTIFNLEMSISPEIVKIACRIKPDQATLVPENRKEITTEGGLNVVKGFKKIIDVVRKLQEQNIQVNLFIDADLRQIEAAKAAGAEMIELHTGPYAQAKTKMTRTLELKKLNQMTECGRQMGLTVNAGHGLNYENVQAVAAIPGITELNIGHSIIARAVFVGLKNAVEDMLARIE